MPLGDILSVRAVMVENGEYSPLVDALIEGLGHANPRVRFDCAHVMDQTSPHDVGHIFTPGLARNATLNSSPPTPTACSPPNSVASKPTATTSTRCCLA